MTQTNSDDEGTPETEARTEDKPGVEPIKFPAGWFNSADVDYGWDYESSDSPS